VSKLSALERFAKIAVINLGKKDLHILEDHWTAVTNDGSLSAQFEQTILITREGFESLTPYDLDEPLLR